MNPVHSISRLDTNKTHTPPRKRIVSHSARDQLTRSKKKNDVETILEIPITKPILPAPIWKVCDNLLRLQKLGETRLNMTSKLVDDHIDKIKKLSQEHVELFQKAAQKAQTSATWSTLNQVGSCIVAAFSTMFGISVASAGGSALIAGSLIGSGVLSITNLAFTSMGLWEKAALEMYPDNQEQREKFLRTVPTAIGLLSTGLGVAGGIAAWSTHAAAFANQVPHAAQAIMDGAQGITALGTGISKAETDFAKAAVNHLDVKMFQEQQALDLFKNNFESMISVLSESHSKMARIINLSSNICSEIMG